MTRVCTHFFLGYAPISILQLLRVPPSGSFSDALSGCCQPLLQFLSDLQLGPEMDVCPSVTSKLNRCGQIV